MHQDSDAIHPNSEPAHDEKKVGTDPSGHIDMASLVQFNTSLASAALGQLYANGARSEVLHWASKLDIFEATHLQKKGEERRVYGSLFDLVLAAGDQEALESFEHDERRGKAMYLHRINTVAKAVAVHAESNAALSGWLLGKMEHHIHREYGTPSASGTQSLYYSDSSTWNDLASAACRYKQYDWLPKIHQLAQCHGKVLSYGDLMRQYVIPEAQVEVARALVKGGRLNEMFIHEMALRFSQESSPEKEIFWRELMALNLKMQTTKSKADAAALNWSVKVCLWEKPWLTPPRWLDWALEQGVDGFNHRARSGLGLVFELVANDWRESVEFWTPNGSTQTKAERARQVRLERESALLPLVTKMLDSSPGSIDTKISTGDLPSSMKRAFSGSGAGARKVDLLALCVAQGYFQIAEAVRVRGADWRFASKQCLQWMILVDPQLEGPDDLSQRRAYLEGLALREVSVKAQTKTFKKSMKTKSSLDRAPQAPALKRL